jgi:hypothetical protein
MKVNIINTPFLIHTYWTINMEQPDYTRQFMIMSEIGTMDNLESCMSMGVHL